MNIGQNPADQVLRYSPLRRMLMTAAILSASWLLWSGLFKALLIGLGGFSIILTLYILQRMGYFSSEISAFGYSPRLFDYWGWLGKQIIKSSLEVTRIVLSPRICVEPKIFSLDVSNLEPFDQVLLGNSITLTPGSLTLDVHNGRILVHALTPSAMEDLQQGEMQRRVATLRKG